MADKNNTTIYSPDDETSEIIGTMVLQMVDKLGFAPDCVAKWSFEIDDQNYEIQVRRRDKKED